MAVSQSGELLRELVPAAMVVEEHRRAPEQWWEGELLGKGDVGTPRRAGVLAEGAEGLRRGVLMVWAGCWGGNCPSARVGEAWE